MPLPSRSPASRAGRRPALSWEQEGRDWPNREASRFLEAGGMSWHVQVVGQGPVLLLVHGTGASTHSWRDLLPQLAGRFTVVAPDLPGHAFSGRPASDRMTLPGMASALADLMRVMDLDPRLAVGHSAGAAVLAQMALDRSIAPAGLVSLNGALLPIGGLAGQIFSPLAKIFATSSVMPRLFSRWANDIEVVERMLGQTGSRLDRTGIDLYRRLARDPGHTAGALAMMANWDLHPLVERLPALPVPLLLVVGSRDGSVPPDDAFRVRALVPGATVRTLKGLGHLAHEETPGPMVSLILEQAEAWGVFAG